MRVLIWCANLISTGGGARLLAHLLPAMARQPDIDLVRLVIAPETDFKTRIDGMGCPNIEIVYFNGSIGSSAGEALLTDVHVIYFFWPHGPEYVQVQLPTVGTFHDTTVLDVVPPFLTGRVVHQVWCTAQAWIDNLTAVVVSSHHVKARLITHFGSAATESHVIEHAILPATPIVEAAVSAELALRLPQRYVVYPSNLAPHKNHYQLLLAYARFSERHQTPLVLFGYQTELLRHQPPDWPDPVYVPTLIALMQRIGLQIDQEVYPLGFVADAQVMPLVRQAQALIMPSLAEGGGSYPVEEALRLGVPVLCSDIPVMREHLKRHSAEIVWFDPESSASIVQALQRLFTNYAYYKSSAVVGMQDPTETWDQIAQKYIHVFRLAYLKHYGMSPTR